MNNQESRWVRRERATGHVRPRLLAVSLCLILLAGCGDPGPLRFSIRVEDFDGLAVGQPVFYRGAPIGRVTRIQLTESGSVIGVEILPEYRDSVYREMHFTIAEDTTEGAVLVLEDFGDRKTGIDDGATVDARPGWRTLLSRKLEELGAATRETLEEAGVAIDNVIDAWKHSPEAEAFRERLREIGQDVRTVARSRYSHFVESELPGLESKARAYREQLEKQGRKREAEIFWKWFERWSEALKSASEAVKDETTGQEPRDKEELLPESEDGQNESFQETPDSG